MRPPRTPWANTLRITGPIFIHHARESKLSQVACYVGNVVRRGSPGHAGAAVGVRSREFFRRGVAGRCRNTGRSADRRGVGLTVAGLTDGPAGQLEKREKRPDPWGTSIT